MTRMRYTQAINETLLAEMERNPEIVLFGEDIELSIFGDTRGAIAKFGPDRVRNTPICEATLAGMAVGAAATGRRVVFHLFFTNFIYTAMDAIGNQMSRLKLMSGGQVDLPLTVLAVYGGGASNAAQHSDAVPPSLLNVGGIDVAVPATPADAKGLLTSALRSNTPTFFLTGAGLGATAGEVPDGDYMVPLGKAAILTEGRDVTIVTIGSTLRVAQDATKALAADGISAELIDIRSLVPLDEQTIFDSVAKTGRLIVVDEGRERCSAASEIAAATVEKAFGSLRAPIVRIASPNVSLPYAPVAEAAVMPSAERVIRAARSLVGEFEEVAAQ